ncbi:MAG: hypothetical protein JWP13_883, partial [Candidatus Saccharibacteria bacterium]|nr:hypothetical protein [Candidatus Saccharibacteria bacterium]
GNGNIPPYGYGGMPVPPGGGFGPGRPAAPAQAGYNLVNPAVLANMVPKEEALAYERRAMGQGLLIGGIIGYLIGRRRGRIKTEKKLIPIQKKLEKQVTLLHASVFEKEERIRKLAAEKAQTLRTIEERQRFMERMTPRTTERLPIASQRSELGRSSLALPQAERLGRVLVEAPAVAAVGTAGAMSAIGLRAPRQESVRATIDMNRKVETYTTPELKQAAAKIRVEGVSLKELWDTGRLDEPALRRVMTQFIKGESVHAALNQELFEKELRFEKDPKVRDRILGQSPGGGAISGVAAVAGAALLRREAPNAVESQNYSQTTSAEEKKTKQKTAGDKARQQEKIELAAGLGVLAIIIVLIVISL